MRRFFSTYQQLYRARKPQRGGDEVGARRKDIYSFDFVPIRDEHFAWAYSIPKVAAPVSEAPVLELKRTIPTDPDSVRRLEILTRVNAHLASLAK